MLSAFIPLLLLLPLGGAAPAETAPIEGEPIDEIVVVGLKRTREYVVRRELVSMIGQPLSLHDVGRDRMELERLGIFAKVEVVPRRVDGKVRLEVLGAETFPYLPTIALKYSDEDDVQYGGGFKSVSLFGRGIYFSGLVLGGGATNVELRMSGDWIAGKRLGFNLEFFQRERTNELYGFEETATEVYATLRREFGHGMWLGTRLFYQSIGSDVPGITLSPDLRDDVPGATLFVRQDTRDSTQNPKSGWWNELELQRHGLSGDSDFWRLAVDLRRFVRAGAHHTILLTSLTEVTSGEVGIDLGTWQQFSVGGTSSVRGWDLASRQGKNETINTVEYRWNFLEPRVIRPFGFTAHLGLQLAGFAELGCAWSDEFRGSECIDGYGIGLRLLLPFAGIARLDFGFGEPGTSIQVHFGSQEKSVRQRERVR